MQLLLRLELHLRFFCPQENSDLSSLGSFPFQGRPHPTFQGRTRLKSSHYTHRRKEVLGKYMNKLRKKERGTKKDKLQMSKMNLSQTKKTGSKRSNSAIALARSSLVNS